jgi:hypothetical protein
MFFQGRVVMSWLKWWSVGGRGWGEGEGEKERWRRERERDFFLCWLSSFLVVWVAWFVGGVCVCLLRAVAFFGAWMMTYACVRVCGYERYCRKEKEGRRIGSSTQTCLLAVLECVCVCVCLCVSVKINVPSIECEDPKKESRRPNGPPFF